MNSTSKNGKIIFKNLFNAKFNLNKIKEKCNYHTKFLKEVFCFGSIIRYRVAQGYSSYGVYVKLMAVGFLASKTAS